MVSEEGLHAAGDDIWCQKDYMRQMMIYGIRRMITCCRLLNMASEVLHAADDEMWCQKDYMQQMMKYGIRRITSCI